MTETPLAGRVALVTGGGGGIGRSHALTLARYGACVVVNDYGGSLDGTGAGSDRSDTVVCEIIEAGGEAVAHGGDVGSWADAEEMVGTAIDRFGGLDILVNNAGILRPKTLVGMTEQDLRAVVQVHLIGSFATTHFAAIHWRQRYKESGIGGGRLINTTSASGLFGFAQANYAASKAGIAALTMIAALELAPYGVTSNAISPVVLTRMSAGIAPDTHTPDHAAELVAWLSTDAAGDVSGHVFNIGGGHVSIVNRWHTGPSLDKAGLWTLGELGEAVQSLVGAAAPQPDFLGYYPNEARSALLPILEMPRNTRGSGGRK